MKLGVLHSELGDIIILLKETDPDTTSIYTKFCASNMKELEAMYDKDDLLVMLCAARVGKIFNKDTPK